MALFFLLFVFGNLAKENERYSQQTLLYYHEMYMLIYITTYYISPLFKVLCYSFRKCTNC